MFIQSGNCDAMFAREKEIISIGNKIQTEDGQLINYLLVMLELLVIRETIDKTTYWICSAQYFQDFHLLDKNSTSGPHW